MLVFRQKKFSVKSIEKIKEAFTGNNGSLNVGTDKLTTKDLGKFFISDKNKNISSLKEISSIQKAIEALSSGKEKVLNAVKSGKESAASTLKNSPALLENAKKNAAKSAEKVSNNVRQKTAGFLTGLAKKIAK